MVSQSVFCCYYKVPKSRKFIKNRSLFGSMVLEAGKSRPWYTGFHSASGEALMMHLNMVEGNAWRDIGKVLAQVSLFLQSHKCHHGPTLMPHLFLITSQRHHSQMLLT
jgi:hypothetical protein